MSKERQEKAQKLIEKDRALLRREHEDFDAQIILSDLLYIYLETPRWKVWEWYPIIRHVNLMEHLHANCCGLEID